MREFYEENKHLINKLLFLCFGAVLIYVFFNYIFSYVAPFVAGYILSLLLNPIVNFLQKRLRLHRGLGALLVLLLCITLIVFAGTALVTRLIEEGTSFADNLPDIIGNIQSVLENLSSNVERWLLLIPDGFEEYLNNIINELFSAIISLVKTGVSNGSMVIVTKVPSLVTTTILMVISAFFFIKDKDLIKRSLAGLVPRWLKGNLRTVRTGALQAIGGYFKAQLILMCVVASICILGLTILGNPYSVLIGVGIAVIDMLPIFGTGFILWPWIIYSLIVGAYTDAIGLGIIYGVVFLTRQMLEPRVVSQQIGIHPLITLMSIYAGLKLFGIAGLILGPVICVSVKAIWQADPVKE